ncbi:universal stress protein [uncultured Kordia sp.]|uniref:universal stress protein n=1 Tax=uncultured Kordia sp. TaxID=507699 RepID=UPI002602F7FE|nr:universal stress protein [uncultured Kordia sp.]
MKNILVPIGDSENAKNTLQYAIDFAEAINAKVFVFRAFKVLSKAGTILNVDEIVGRETASKVKEVVASVNLKKVDVSVISAKGNVIDSINSIDKELGVDLIIVGPRSNSIKEEMFLGNTSGSIVKQTDISVLVVPEGYTFKPIKKVLTAIKSGAIKRKGILSPLETILDVFGAKMRLLQVKTPNFLPEDLEFHSELAAITSGYKSSENSTLFQGVLEHLNENNPDLICVFRRKRGFFKKLWEQNTVKKVDFESRLPLLVLKGTD